jgi:hypothetical protein
MTTRTTLMRARKTRRSRLLVESTPFLTCLGCLASRT